GAGDEQDESGDPGEQLQVRGIVFLHGLDSGTAGSEPGVDFGETPGVFGALIILVVGSEGLADGDVNLLFEDLLFCWCCSDAGFYAADDVDPALARVVHKLCIGQRHSGCDGQIVFGRGAGEAIAVEASRCDADDGDGFGVDPEGAADDGGVAVVGVLPCV